MERRRVVLRLQSAAIKGSVDSINLTIGARASFSECDGALSVPAPEHRASLAPARPGVRSS
jgi:hypothetical protein